MTSKELSVIICVSGLVANYRESEKYGVFIEPTSTNEDDKFVLFVRNMENNRTSSKEYYISSFVELVDRDDWLCEHFAKELVTLISYVSQEFMYEEICTVYGLSQ